MFSVRTIRTLGEKVRVPSQNDSWHALFSEVYRSAHRKCVCTHVTPAGEFEDGARKGLGCLVWKDGAQYAGDWYSDKPSGFGVENYPDGSSYGGQYEDDMRHGYGTYTFPSGAKYEVFGAVCLVASKFEERALLLIVTLIVSSSRKFCALPFILPPIMRCVLCFS